jgi:PS-10 peptidase S37
MRFVPTLTLIVLATSFSACGRLSSSVSHLKSIPAYTDDIANPQIQACIDSRSEIDAKLICIPGLTIEQEVFSNVPAGYRRLDLKFSQPLDQNYPRGKRFSQSLILWHKRSSEPMILHTSGYKIFNKQLYLLAQRWQTNQIQVAHRYFEGAEPEDSPRDWSYLNVIQSAADFHRIVVALKQIYPARWVNNGASKGGMTSVFTRRFYPDDFAGTVADVAPLSFAPEDSRYLDFVDSVGGAPLAECRTKLRQLQGALLERRDEFVTRLDPNARFKHLGSSDVAFEHAVISMPYGFHQYHNVRPDDPVRCETIPAVDADSGTIWKWLVEASDPNGLSDDEIKVFVPYYYQANTELGGSADRIDLFAGLLRHPYNALMYGPKNVSQIYSQNAMRDIEEWVRVKSERIMFVYGEHDPWTAAMFPVRTDAESNRFIVPKGNHSAKFINLDEPDRAQFIQNLNRWLDKRMPLSLDGDITLPLEDPRVPL